MWLPGPDSKSVVSCSAHTSHGRFRPARAPRVSCQRPAAEDSRHWLPAVEGMAIPARLPSRTPRAARDAFLELIDGGPIIAVERSAPRLHSSRRRRWTLCISPLGSFGSSRLLVSPSHPAAIPRARPPNSYGEKSPLQSATLPGNRVNLRGVRGPPNRARARCGAEFFRKVRAGAPRRSQRSSAP